MKNLTTMFAVCFLFLSCSKDIDDEIPKTAKNCKVTEIIDGNETFFLTYDNKDRVIKIAALNSSDFATYNYQSDKIVVTVGKNVKTFLLNPAGLIYKFTDGDDTYDYSYNADGYLVKVTQKNSRDTKWLLIRNLSYTNGNLTSIMRDPSTNQIPWTITVTYQSDVFVNMFGFNHPLELYGPDPFLFAPDLIINYGGYFGKAPKNMPVSYTVNSTSKTETYTYQKDSDGKISSIKAHGSVTSFVYKCQ
jgi:YD repeat-containing protein